MPNNLILSRTRTLADIPLLELTPAKIAAAIGSIAASGLISEKVLIDMTHVSEMVRQLGYERFSYLVEVINDEIATRVGKMQRTLTSNCAEYCEAEFHYMRGLALVAGMSQLAHLLSTFGPDQVTQSGHVSVSYVMRVSRVADDSLLHIWDSPALN